MSKVLLTGATGYVGGNLLPALLEAGYDVRALTRNPGKADLPAEVEVFRGDVVAGDGLERALAGCDVAFYLVHSMEAGKGSFEERDGKAARNFAEAAFAAGIGRVIYLGGLEGEDTPSAHLRSRHEVASILRESLGDRLVYARAAMIVGEGSAAFEMIRHLVARLPLMVTPRWVDTRTQPVAIEDVVATFVRLVSAPSAPAEVELGGAEILTYREMIARYAALTGRYKRLLIPVPVLTPRLSSYWVQLVTPLDRELIRPLIEGLGTEMIVRRPPSSDLVGEPMGFNDAVRTALGDAGHGTIVSDLSDDTSTSADGAVTSHQAAELELAPGPAGHLWSDQNLERLARTYWAFLSTWTLGLIRVHYTEGERYVCLLSPRLRLLTFAAPEYEIEDDRARVRWRIKEGLLVDPNASSRDGYLGIDVTRLGNDGDSDHVRIDVEVANFYPAIASRIGRIIYENTQSRIHILVTHGFLRRLVRRDLEKSVTGRFA